MKKFYFIFIFAMLAACSVALVSCGDDDDDNSANESALIGTWSYEESTLGITITFNANKEFRLEEWDAFEGSDYDFGTWSMNGSTVILKYDDGYTDIATLYGQILIYDEYKFTKTR